MSTTRTTPESTAPARQAPTGPDRRPGPRLRRAARRHLAELAYALLLVVPGAVLGLAVLPLLAAALVLSVTQLGLPLLAAVLAGARALGRFHRLLLARLLGERIPAPPAPGPRRVRDTLRDPAAWRAAAFDPAAALLGLVLFAVSVFGRLYALAGATYPLWWRAVSTDGRPGVGSGFPDYPLDTWSRSLVLSAVSLAALVLLTWLSRRLLTVLRLLGRTLLGPDRLAGRVRDLERTRAAAVTDADATLRRIERDLHDGAQARLIAVAMALAGAQHHLRAPEGLERGRDLVGQALRNSREAIAELRDLVRGIHPPVLDEGLAPALRSLAEQSPLPVRVRADLPERVPPAIEAIAYFCAAELLANAAKHAGPCSVEIGVRTAARGPADTGEDEAGADTGAGSGAADWPGAGTSAGPRPGGGRLELTVRDDGRGGAAPAPGPGSTGLAGLAERVRTVDGALRISSPPGGPTDVLVVLPVELGDGAPPPPPDTAPGRSAGAR